MFIAIGQLLNMDLRGIIWKFNCNLSWNAYNLCHGKWFTLQEFTAFLTWKTIILCHGKCLTLQEFTAFLTWKTRVLCHGKWFTLQEFASFFTWKTIEHILFYLVILIWSFWLTIQNLGINFFGNYYLFIYLPTYPPTNLSTYLNN
jgi:hypothetical protein